MNKDLKNYLNLCDISKKIHTFKGISYLLGWDQETYMPKGAINSRSNQLALMNKLIHEKSTDKKFESALSKLIEISSGKIIATSLNAEQKVAVKEWRKTFVKDKKLPPKFVSEFSQLTSQAMHTWAQAKKENSFIKFAPFLERIVEMSRKKAELIGYKNHPYDALLDTFEPGITTKELTRLFNEIKTPTIQLLKKISTKSTINDSFLFGSFSKNKQLKLAHEFLKTVNYDTSHGRLDLSAHPFTTNFHPTDVRITTAIKTSDLLFSISATIHEFGHALYEMGLPKEKYGSPLCEAISYGIHESQSRIWETCIGQSKAFWQYFLPMLKKHFPNLKKVTLPQLYRAINKIKSSPIRISSDEISYNLHIIIRFEIEKELIEGKLSIRDIPDIWNEKMQKYLNITPKNDSEGCLQDIHWSMGGFGYFPSYTLGNIYAASFFQALKDEYPTWEKEIAKGNFTFIKEWLYNNIHKHGKRYTAKQITKRICKDKLSVQPFTTYLNNKYNDIYKL